MARFTVPRDIYYGKGAMEQLSSLKGYKKAMIVTGGSSMQRFGFISRLEGILHTADLETERFEGVEPDPSIETVQRGAEAMRSFQPDVIVAIGGGSPIDAAKAMWVFYEYPNLTFEDIKTPFTMPKLRRRAIFVAIPSTSGTASEVTAFSVITDYSTQIKYPLADFEITPDIAVLDTDIPLTMPPVLAAHTGMDALTHAIEAYVASARSAFSDPYALHAISEVYENLLASFHGDEQARCAIHYAQCLAGMAFSNALLGITHSLAHKTGAVFDLPHGLCNAIYLPYVIEFNAKSCAQRYAQISQAMGLAGATDRQKVNALVCAVKKMNKALGIAQSFQENGVDEALLHERADAIAENAQLDPCTGSNPRPADKTQLKEILECAYYGKPVAF